MSSIKINQALHNIESGDVVKYFDIQDQIIQTNDGIHDFKTLTSDCYSPNCPLAVGTFTKFKITDPAVDIINIDKGYLNFKATFTFRMTKVSGGAYTQNANTDNAFKNYYVFVGFKSASHIIDQYRIYSNGRKTSCEQTRALYEQTIARLSKCNEEIQSRPKMYTSFENAHEGKDCVCGTYIKISDLLNGPVTKQLDLAIQIDDLLPFSAMEMFPNFLFGNLELELNTRITQNMVWCMVDLMAGYKKSISTGTYMTSARPSDDEIRFNDYQVPKSFVQFGDSSNITFPDWLSPNVIAGFMEVIMTCDSMTINEAQSHISGFNIKDSTKQVLASKYSDNFIIPGQWIEQTTLPQQPTASGIRCNTVAPLWNATSLVFIYPRTPNQITVSKNPLQTAVKCTVDSKVIPDKTMDTLASEHSEMILSNLSLDSLWSAPKSIVNSLVFREYNTDLNTKAQTPFDNTDYLFVVNLERPGSGIFFDGYTSTNCQLTLSSDHMFGTNNPAYFKNGSINSSISNIIMCQLSDCYWVCSSRGIELIKNVQA